MFFSFKFYSVSVRPKQPILSVTPPDATIETGTTLTFTCNTDSSSSAPVSQYKLYRNGDVVAGANDSGVVGMTPIVASTGSEIYSCTASINGVESINSANLSVTVIGKY